MNRAEQKELLKHIIEVAKSTVNSLKSKEEWFEITLRKVEELWERLDDVGGLDDYDEQDIKESIIKNFFESELEELHDLAVDFQDNLDSYRDELSESRQESLSEKYFDLDEVVEKFNQSSAEYDDIENAVEHIEEAIVMLSEMRK